MSDSAFDYASWVGRTLHPEDRKRFDELLGGAPELGDLLQIQLGHLEALDDMGGTPGCAQRVLSALEGLRLGQENSKLQQELKTARANGGSAATGGSATGGAAEGDDTWEQHFTRLEGVLSELKRMNDAYPEVEEGVGNAQGSPEPVASETKEVKDEKGAKNASAEAGTDAVSADSMPVNRMKDPKNPCREDFVINGLSNTKVLRNPGEGMGQAFVFSNLTDCQVLIFDNTAQITADDCKNCTFFIGPCEGSVFVRTCQGCKIVVSCNQFRTRDCKNLDVLLHCAQGQPVIEASENVRFGPFDGAYAELADQLRAAGLSPWDTEWANVHDFTPDEGAKHYEFLPDSTRAADLLGAPIATLGGKVAPFGAAVVPRASGQSRDDKSGLCFALVGEDDGAPQSALNAAGKAALIRSRRREMSARQLDDLKTVAGAALASGASVAPKAGGVVGFEFSGQGSSEAVAKALGGGPGLVVTGVLAKAVAKEFYGGCAK